jgi:5-keto 4-deoxyuronate isomerase
MDGKIIRLRNNKLIDMAKKTPELKLKDYKSNTFVDQGMEIRFAVGPEETKQFDTQKLADNFLVSNLMVPGQIKLVYTHYDRMIIGGAVPVSKVLTLPNHPELRAVIF